MTGDSQVLRAFTTEYGLQLPDGTEIWPPGTWHGAPIDTVDGRHKILDALIQTSANIGMETSQLLARYQWLARQREQITVVLYGVVEPLPVDHPDAIGDDEAGVEIVSAAGEDEIAVAEEIVED